MGWKRQDKENGPALKRIVAMLFALADLADQASSRSCLVRCLVFWILRPAEAVAWEFVLEAQAGVPMRSAPMIACSRDGPADVVQLARTFRALAVMLDSLPAQASAGWQTGCRVQPLDVLDRFRQVFRRPALQAPARHCPDTS